MMQAGDYDQLLYTGKYCVSCSSQVLGHPDKGGCDAGSQAAPYRADDHKQKECADQSGKKRRYQQPDYFRYFLFKKDIQLGCNDADQQGNDDSALETIKQIESGFLQTLPSAIIVSLVTSIWSKLKIIVKKNKPEGNSSWERIEKNTKKIDKEFENHDYILTEDIEGIFGISREEIQPLLKLLGCKCFVYKKRSIWIKPGTKEEKIKKILKQHNFKYRH